MPPSCRARCSVLSLSPVRALRPTLHSRGGRAWGSCGGAVFPAQLDSGQDTRAWPPTPSLIAHRRSPCSPCKGDAPLSSSLPSLLWSLPYSRIPLGAFRKEAGGTRESSRGAFRSADGAAASRQRPGVPRRTMEAAPGPSARTPSHAEFPGLGQRQPCRSPRWLTLWWPLCPGRRVWAAVRRGLRAREAGVVLSAHRCRPCRQEAGRQAWGQGGPRRGRGWTRLRGGGGRGLRNPARPGPKRVILAALPLSRLKDFNR